jgi:Xaa-Pro dipeptidase
MYLILFSNLDCRAIRQAYLPIVASSARASTLHYCCNDKAFAWGPVESKTSAFHHPHLHAGGLEQSAVLRQPGSSPVPQVLLIDAGCEWENYASDSEFLILHNNSN